MFRSVPFEWSGAEGWLPELHGAHPWWGVGEQTLVGLAAFGLVVGASFVLRRRGERAGE